MLPSVVPRLTTDSAVRVFSGVWKLLSLLRLPFQDGALSLLFCLSSCLLYFFLPPFEDNWLLFWVPDVLCWHSKVVLWNFLSVQMFFWWIWKDPDSGKDWRQEEKGTTEDKMVGWHHQPNGHGFGWTPGVGDGQGGLACCGSWGCKESGMTERLNWTELNLMLFYLYFPDHQGV